MKKFRLKCGKNRFNKLTKKQIASDNAFKHFTFYILNSEF